MAGPWVKGGHCIDAYAPVSSGGKTAPATHSGAVGADYRIRSGCWRRIFALSRRLRFRHFGDNRCVRRFLNCSFFNNFCS